MALNVETATAVPAASIYALPLALGRGLRCGRLALELPDGDSYVFEGDGPGPQAALTILRPRFVRRLLTGGATGFAEAYIEGDCETPDLLAVIELAALNHDVWEQVLRGRLLFRAMQRAWHSLRPNTRRGAQRNIAHHYDLGNDFYRPWLDPDMIYSAAIFDTPEQPLEDAQDRKFRHIARLAELQPGQHVLEIGCGWGGFAIFAAREIGCRVTAITISEEQFAHAAARIQREGLGDRIELRLQDYRDLARQYDRIVSIEMLEAVGEAYWPLFFEKLRGSLAPGGQAALQVITIADELWDGYRRSTDFIQRYIFPGGLLPSRDALRVQVARADLAWDADHAYGVDYARTLNHWRRRFESAEAELAAQGFDERFRRMWRYYFCYCEAGFKTGRIDVRQIGLSRSR